MVRFRLLDLRRAQRCRTDVPSDCNPSCGLRVPQAVFNGYSNDDGSYDAFYALVDGLGFECESIDGTTVAFLRMNRLRSGSRPEPQEGWIWRHHRTWRVGAKPLQQASSRINLLWCQKLMSVAYRGGCQGITLNSFALVIKETKHAALALPKATVSHGGYGQTGHKAPVSDDTAMAMQMAGTVWRAKRRFADGNVSYSDGSKYYCP